MDCLSPLLPFGFVQSDHLTRGPVSGKQDPALLKELPDSGPSVIDGFVMSLRITCRRTFPILFRYVSSRKDMRGRERRRSLDSMQQENFVLRGDEDYAAFVICQISPMTSFV